MKKILVLGLTIVLALGAFAGCGQQQGQVSEDISQQPQQEAQVQPAPEPESEQQNGTQEGVIVEDGVAMDPSEYDLISEEEAKQIALGKVEGAQEENLSRLDLDYDDGRWTYEGEIYLGDWEYEFEINAENGNVIGWEKDHIYD